VVFAVGGNPHENCDQAASADAASDECSSADGPLVVAGPAVVPWCPHRRVGLHRLFGETAGERPDQVGDRPIPGTLRLESEGSGVNVFCIVGEDTFDTILRYTKSRALQGQEGALVGYPHIIFTLCEHQQQPLAFIKMRIVFP
jgi:hypothetical protein